MEREEGRNKDKGVFLFVNPLHGEIDKAQKPTFDLEELKKFKEQK